MANVWRVGKVYWHPRIPKTRKLQSSFSRYRRFQRSWKTRHKGQSYETDAEFYDDDGQIWLQLEAKQSESQLKRIDKSVRRAVVLTALPADIRKDWSMCLNSILGISGWLPQDASTTLSMSSRLSLKKMRHVSAHLRGTRSSYSKENAWMMAQSAGRVNLMSAPW